MILPQLCFAVDQISVSLYFDELKCFGHLMVKYLFDECIHIPSHLTAIVIGYKRILSNVVHELIGSILMNRHGHKG
jgi:hypothetical protein